MQSEGREAPNKLSGNRTMTTILVTGGAGFLGSHLCERLLALGDRVVCLDNFSTVDDRNIRGLGSNSSFRVLARDVVEPINLDVDAIYNLACPASPRRYQADPIQTLKTNVLGALNVLALADRNRARVFQASTSEIYGDPEVSPQSESYWGRVNPVGPRSVYDEAKRFAEATTMAYHRYHGVDTHIVRIFNTYGPRMRLNDGRALPNFVFQALSGQALTVYGDGKQTRSFCYVSDLIEGIYRLSQSDEHYPTNIGNPNEITIYEFAERIRAHFPNALAIIHGPLPEDDPQQRCPDITKAKNLLGWEPKVSLEEGLRLTLEFFKAQFSKLPAGR